MSRIGRMPIAIPAGVTRKQTKRLEEDAFTSWSYKNSHSQHGNWCN